MNFFQGKAREKYEKESSGKSGPFDLEEETEVKRSFRNRSLEKYELVKKGEGMRKGVQSEDLEQKSAFFRKLKADRGLQKNKWG